MLSSQCLKLGHMATPSYQGDLEKRIWQSRKNHHDWLRPITTHSLGLETSQAHALEAGREAGCSWLLGK